MPASPMPIVLYRDEGHVIVDKSAGLPCYPGRLGGPSVESFFPMLSRRRTGPWLAHRLDRDTAGCLLVALKRDALIAAQAAFHKRTAIKTYWAVVTGRPGATSGVITAPLSKRRDRTAWRMVADLEGDDAITAWRVLGSGGGLSAIAFQPKTGRTHQVRAHAQLLGCPLLGDEIYGSPSPHGLQLLARSLSLGGGSPVQATAPVPPHMRASLTLCGITPAGTTAETAPSPASSVV